MLFKLITICLSLSLIATTTYAQASGPEPEPPLFPTRDALRIAYNPVIVAGIIVTTGLAAPVSGVGAPVTISLGMLGVVVVYQDFASGIRAMEQYRRAMEEWEIEHEKWRKANLTGYAQYAIPYSLNYLDLVIDEMYFNYMLQSVLHSSWW